MRIRQGFVSNSSSSSFVVIGFTIPEIMTQEMIARKLFDSDIDFPTPDKTELIKVRGCSHKKMNCNFCPECGKPMWIDETNDHYKSRFNSYIYSLFHKENLYFDEFKNFLGVKALSCYGTDTKEIQLLEWNNMVERVKNIQKKLRLSATNLVISLSTLAGQ